MGRKGMQQESDEMENEGRMNVKNRMKIEPSHLGEYSRKRDKERCKGFQTVIKRLAVPKHAQLTDFETYYMFLYPMPKPSLPAVSPHSLEASADSLPPGLAETATIRLPVKRVDSSVLEIRFDA